MRLCDFLCSLPGGQSSEWRGAAVHRGTGSWSQREGGHGPDYSALTNAGSLCRSKRKRRKERGAGGTGGGGPTAGGRRGRIPVTASVTTRSGQWGAGREGPAPAQVWLWPRPWTLRGGGAGSLGAGPALQPPSHENRCQKNEHKVLHQTEEGQPEAGSTGGEGIQAIFVLAPRAG